jgi:hypothetical protein
MDRLPPRRKNFIVKGRAKKDILRARRLDVFAHEIRVICVAAILLKAQRSVFSRARRQRFVKTEKPATTEVKGILATCAAYLNCASILRCEILRNAMPSVDSYRNLWRRAGSNLSVGSLRGKAEEAESEEGWRSRAAGRIR